MATDAQINANKLNAQKSTGPKTAAGKAVSRRNAITHGLSAKAVILDGEDPKLFDSMREQILLEFGPRTVIEAELVEQLICILWRLRRVPVFEAAVTEWVAFRTLKAGATNMLAPVMPINTGTLGTPLPGSDAFMHTSGVTLEKLLEEDLLLKLGRHEAHLRRELQKIMKQLRDLRTPLEGARDPDQFDDEELRRAEIEWRREHYRDLL